MTHEAASDKLLDLAYGELSRGEASQVEEHAAGCDACRAELDRIRETRRLVSALPPVEAPERGENVLLAAARERARLREPRWQVPRWLLGASVAAASLAVVAAVSYRIIAMNPGPLGKSEHDALLGEARPGEKERAIVAPQAPAVAVAPAPPEDREARVAAAPTPPSRSDAARERERAKPFHDDRVGPRTGGEDEAGGGRGEAFGGSGIRSAPQRFAEPPPAGTASEAPARSEAFAKKAEPEAPAASAAARERAPAAGVAAAPPAQAEPLATPAPPAAKAAPSRSAAKAASRAPSAPEAAELGYEGALADRAEAPADEDAVARWESLRAAGKLSVEVRRLSGCDAGGDHDRHHFAESFRKLERDPRGRLVRYEMHGTAEGTPFQAEGFYDASGALRVERWNPERGKPTELRHSAAGPTKRTWFPAQASGVRIDAPGLCER